MDEQRMQAYVGLIEQLLGCPQGQEREVLQVNVELVDLGLLEVIEQYSTHLETEGNSKAAKWLREFAVPLAQALEIVAAQEAVTRGNSEEAMAEGFRSETGEFQTQEAMIRGNSEEAAYFLLETLQFIANSGGNPQQVYQIWAQKQAQLNLALLKVLPLVVAQLYEQKPEQRIAIAADLLTFGNRINQFPLGIRWLNLELGIAAYEQALQVYTRHAFPIEWAMTQNNLASAYSRRIRGNRADNLENAIAVSEQALQVYTQDIFPEQWATTQNTLAIAYFYSTKGNRAENLEKAIAAFKQALQIRTQEAFPQDWADTQNSLASAYAERIKGERADNLEVAINLYEQALQIRTRDAFPVEWAMTQNNLANIYSQRIKGERANNLESAIIAYEHALQVLTRDAVPEQWAAIQNNLVLTYKNRIQGNRTENLKKAIAASQQALQVYTRDAFSEQWAAIQNNLALVYSELTQGDREENLEAAITACEQALQVYTRHAFPVDWAMTQINLASAYSQRIRGERADNLETTITAYKQVLEVYTRDAFPERWAIAQNNLANTYASRIRGKRADNLKAAITAYEQALQVLTHRIFPRECRQTARYLGDLYSEQKSWLKAARSYIHAFRAAEILYRSGILLEGKAAELNATANLPHLTSYAIARCGHLKAAVLILEQSRARGLSESLDRDHANLTKLQQIAPSLYEQYRDIANQLRNLESQQRNLAFSSDRHSLAPEGDRNSNVYLRQNRDAVIVQTRLDAVIAQIRQVEGYTNFLDQHNFEDVRTALQSDCPLIYLVSTPNGSLALIITPDKIADLWLDNLPQTDFQNWLNTYIPSQADRQTWLNAIDSITQQLWHPLMAPLIHYLKTHDFQQATLIPTGPLSLLPLHAAWMPDLSKPTDRWYALDDIHFTYTPNARSFNAARAIAQRTEADALLAIDNPSLDLPNSELEVKAALAHFPQHQMLRQGEATIVSVREALQHCNILHLSCHGTANLIAPLTSGLLMSDGLLTLKNILDLKLAESATGSIRLAILSACKTGLTGIENVDEAIGLPGGLLQAGVAGVIASLWSVDDLSTRLLLVKFYELWREKKLPPDQALRQAQIWLRDSTEAEIAPLLGMRIRNPTNRPFCHPYYWAAFSYTGV